MHSIFHGDLASEMRGCESKEENRDFLREWKIEAKL